MANLGRTAWLMMVVGTLAVEPVESPAFDWTNSTTWPVAAQYSFVVFKLFFAFSPIIALVAVFFFAWESPEEERLKRNKKADFTFDSPE